MPMTLGPIVMAAAPGTGSFWLQQMLQEPKKGLGMYRGGVGPQIQHGLYSERTVRGTIAPGRVRYGLHRGEDDKVIVRKAIAWKWDRHAPGPCTVTIVRDVSEILRTWFVRFRKAPPPPTSVAAHPDVLLHPPRDARDARPGLPHRGPPEADRGLRAGLRA